MKPPTEAIPSTLVEQIIHAHQKEGVSFAALNSLTAIWPDELAIRDQRLIEARDGKLYPAPRRRRKPEPVAPGFWSRLRAVWAP